MGVVAGIERLHVPLVGELTGEFVPAFLGETIAGVGPTGWDRSPVAGGERGVMADSGDDIRPDGGLQYRRRDLAVGRIAEHLADGVEESSDDQFLVGARALGSCGDLKGMASSLISPPSQTVARLLSMPKACSARLPARSTRSIATILASILWREHPFRGRGRPLLRQT